MRSLKKINARMRGTVLIRRAYIKLYENDIDFNKGNFNQNVIRIFYTITSVNNLRVVYITA